MLRTAQRTRLEPSMLGGVCQIQERRSENPSEERSLSKDQATLRRPHPPARPSANGHQVVLNSVQRQKRAKMASRRNHRSTAVIVKQPNQRSLVQNVAATRMTEQLSLSAYMERVRAETRMEIEEAREQYENIKRRLKEHML